MTYIELLARNPGIAEEIWWMLRDVQMLWWGSC